jgi:hypothetical protein
MTFTESNTVKQMILDSVAPKRHGEPLNIHEDLAPGWRGSLGGELRPARWDYVPAAQLPGQSGDVIMEPWVREALILLNSGIAGGADHHRPDLQIHGRNGPPIEELGGKATFFTGDFKKYRWAPSTRPRRGRNPDDNQKPGTMNHNSDDSAYRFVKKRLQNPFRSLAPLEVRS